MYSIGPFKNSESTHHSYDLLLQVVDFFFLILTNS